MNCLPLGGAAHLGFDAGAGEQAVVDHFGIQAVKAFHLEDIFLGGLFQPLPDALWQAVHHQQSRGRLVRRLLTIEIWIN